MVNGHTENNQGQATVLGTQDPGIGHPSSEFPPGQYWESSGQMIGQNPGHPLMGSLEGMHWGGFGQSQG